jgi:hypothetical protein
MASAPRTKSKGQGEAPEVTQNEPTKPRPRDAAGRELDEHGLPLSGPARIRALDGRPDPRDGTPAEAEAGEIAPAPEAGAPETPEQ